MKTNWFYSVRVKILILVWTICLLSSYSMFYLIRQHQINVTTNTRLSEINRYAVLIASNISLAQHLGSSDNLYSEVDSMSSFYQEARILVLNSNCRVQKDSSNTRRGRTIVNDDILKALNGTAQNHIDGKYANIAVPILDYLSNEVKGVVYVSFSLDKQITRATSIVSSMGLIIMIITIITLILLTSVTLLSFNPLNKIRKWVKAVVDGHSDNIPYERDKSEYGQVVQSMNKLIADLQDVDNSRKEFVSNVSHELKTPLSSMKVLAESLLLEEGIDEATYREFLSDINQEIDRETALVNDLLSLVRLENTKNALNINMVDIDQLAEIILNRLRPLAEQKKVELVLEIASHVEAQIDEMKMTIAISNLVENGIKYNKEGGTVRLKVDSDLSFAIITVSDTGIGIPKEHFGKIFQRFYRVDKARERGAGGTGLGLAIVHQIITMHQGTIDVNSKMEEGTEFTVKFPLISGSNSLVGKAGGVEK